jgi:hypothetical protein
VIQVADKLEAIILVDGPSVDQQSCLNGEPQLAVFNCLVFSKTTAVRVLF